MSAEISPPMTTEQSNDGGDTKRTLKAKVHFAEDVRDETVDTEMKEEESGEPPIEVRRW